MRILRETLDFVFTVAYFILNIIYILSNNQLRKEIKLICVILTVFWWFIVKVLHIIFHELGHFISGKMAGFNAYYISIYGCAFSYNGVKWNVHKNQRKVIGQCLMKPNNSSANCEVYLCGGWLMTLLVVIIDVLYVISSRNQLSIIISNGILFQGIIQIIYNVIPSSVSGETNDAMNYYLIKKDNVNREAFLYQLSMNNRLMMGARLHNINYEDIFKTSSKEYNHTGIMFYVQYILYLYYLDNELFEKAFALMLDINQYYENYPLSVQREIDVELLFIYSFEKNLNRSKCMYDKIIKNQKNYVKNISLYRGLISYKSSFGQHLFAKQLYNELLSKKSNEYYSGCRELDISLISRVLER